MKIRNCDIIKAFGGDNMENNFAHVVILAGQSNACGVARAEYLKKQLPAERFGKLCRGFANVQFIYWSHGEQNNDFEPVSLREGYRSCDVANSFGPEVGFAERFSEKSSEPLFIIKWAYGGSNLFSDWNPDIKELPVCDPGNTAPGWCLGGLFDLMKKALPRIREMSGKEPLIDTFMWMQGESDASEADKTESYIDTFNRLVARLKAEFPDVVAPNLNVIDAGISQIWKFHEEVNEQKRSNPGTIYLDTISAGLTTDREPEGAPDIYHYDSLSMLKLGSMFADAFLNI